MKKLILTLLIFSTGTLCAQNELKYSGATISVGMVVSDFDLSYKFYTEVLGMIKTGGFSIDEGFGKNSGLSNGVPFDVTILKTINSENATELKLLSFNKESTHPKQLHIQDDTGVQYLTFFVESLNPFLEKIQKENIQVLGNGPVGISGGRSLLLIQDPDGTFIELIGPMDK